MDFGALALVMAVGLVGPILASTGRFAPPVVVGQIVAGAIVGAHGLRWIDPTTPLLDGLAEIGFALLMFIVGTHLPVRDRRIRPALAVGAGVAATVAVASLAIGVLLAPHVDLHRPVVIAVLLTTSSAAVALPILQSAGPGGRAALVTTAWIAVADVVTVASLPLVLATGDVWHVALGGVLVVVSGVGLFVLGGVAVDRGWVQQLREESRRRGWGLDLRVQLLALFACAWLAVRFGTSVLIAGFTVGIVVAFLGEPRRVAQQLVGVGEGFAIPVFFVVLGARLDATAFVQSPAALALAAVLSVCGIAVHVAAALAWRLPLGTGLLASAQLGVPVAVVSIGLVTHQIDSTIAAAVMASVLVTLAACALGGVLLGHGGGLTDASAPALPAGTDEADPTAR
jgi:Kef-type K+ transport system membrane component KefB